MLKSLGRVPDRVIGAPATCPSVLPGNLPNRPVVNHGDPCVQAATLLGIHDAHARDFIASLRENLGLGELSSRYYRLRDDEIDLPKFVAQAKELFPDGIDLSTRGVVKLLQTPELCNYDGLNTQLARVLQLGSAKIVTSALGEDAALLASFHVLRNDSIYTDFQHWMAKTVGCPRSLEFPYKWFCHLDHAGCQDPLSSMTALRVWQELERQVPTFPEWLRRFAKKPESFRSEDYRISLHYVDFSLGYRGYAAGELPRPRLPDGTEFFYNVYLDAHLAVMLHHKDRPEAVVSWDIAPEWDQNLQRVSVAQPRGLRIIQLQGVTAKPIGEGNKGKFLPIRGLARIDWGSALSEFVIQAATSIEYLPATARILPADLNPLTKSDRRDPAHVSEQRLYHLYDEVAKRNGYQREGAKYWKKALLPAKESADTKCAESRIPA